MIGHSVVPEALGALVAPETSADFVSLIADGAAFAFVAVSLRGIIEFHLSITVRTYKYHVGVEFQSESEEKA